MNEFKINSTLVSFIIIELKESEALFLKEIMESKLVSYSKIFFELKSYKKLCYKSLDDLSVKLSISGFLTQLDQ